jgi:hypothetical protein
LPAVALEVPAGVLVPVAGALPVAMGALEAAEPATGVFAGSEPDAPATESVVAPAASAESCSVIGASTAPLQAFADL